ncbi:MAG: efflux RND transporter periplasmic adaptor subunit [Bacteroidota bacterium]|nr:efflux RND transporter periplasmic adaptor subunit [Bacteroidota bacterium]
MTTKLKFISTGIVVLGVILSFALNSQPKTDSQSNGNSIATAYSVTVVKAAKQNVSESFSLTGTIAANNDIVVLSETQGRVVKINAEVGDYKPAGSVLVEVDGELKETAYKTAQMTYDKSKKDLDRYEALYKEGSITESQIEQARWNFQSAESQYIVARRQYNDTKITTPISGIVTSRNVNIGSFVQGAPQGTVIANIVDISKLKVKVNVAEKDVFRLKDGDKAEVTTDVFPNVVFVGKISTISSKGDDAHTYPVEVILHNDPKHTLKAGMFGQVTFSASSSNNALVIPRESIIGSLRDAQLYVVQNNIAKLRNVTVGKGVGTEVEILGGLKEGETVVVNGQNNLKDNAPVVIRKN